MADGSNTLADEPEKLEYPACSGVTVTEWSGWVEAGEGGAVDALHGRAARARGDGDDDESDAAGRSFERGRACGCEEGRQLEREAQKALLSAEAQRREQQLTALAARFAQASERYLREVEQEVVKLALAVASRILRREAQMDPLLLTGAVRVALGQLAASSEVRLLVPAAELELWQEAMAHLPNLAMKPVVVAGEGMRLGDCAIESHAGMVDLGVRAQLAEIERGFFDRATANAGHGADGESQEEHA